MLTKLCSLALVMIMAASVSAAEQSSVPKTFSAYIGGFNGPTYLVELRDGALLYTSGEHRQQEHKVITPTSAQWREFRQTLDELVVWQWRPDYTNASSADGTQWRLSLDYPDRGLRSQGSNDFPKHFDRYLAAVRKLLDGEEFR